LSEHHPAAAEEVFERDCLVKIGTCIAPVGVAKPGEPCISIMGNGFNESVPFGELRVIAWDSEKSPELTMEPARNFDVGAGKGKRVTASAFKVAGQKALESGLVGLIVDCRGRPLAFPDGKGARIEALRSTLKAMGLP